MSSSFAKGLWCSSFKVPVGSTAHLKGWSFVNWPLSSSVKTSGLACNSPHICLPGALLWFKKREANILQQNQTGDKYSCHLLFISTRSQQLAASCLPLSFTCQSLNPVLACLICSLQDLSVPPGKIALPQAPCLSWQMDSYHPVEQSCMIGPAALGAPVLLGTQNSCEN